MSDPSRQIPTPTVAASPFELFAGLDPPTSLEGSLTAIAQRLRETFDVDIVIVRVRDDDARRVVRASSTRDPRLDALLHSALGADRDATVDLGLSALEGGSALVWSDLSQTPEVLARIAEIERHGTDVTAARAALIGASCVAMPLRTSAIPNLGALGLINLGSRTPLGERERTAIEALAPQIGLAVQNAVLRDRHARMRQVMESLLATTQNGVIVIDNDGIIGLVNRAYGEILGITESLEGLPAQRVLRDLVRPRFTDPDVYERIALRLEGHPHITLRDQLETVDGRFLERFSAPIRDGDGRKLGRVVILSDITLRQRALVDARSLAETNAELLRREEARAQEEIAMARAAHVLASALTLTDVHEHLVAQVATFVPDTRIVLFDVRRRGDILAVAARGLPDGADLTHLRTARGSGIVGRVADSRRTLICHDVVRDPSIHLGRLEAPGTRSVMAIPLELVDRAYGVLVLYSPRPGTFDERLLRLVTELCQHAATAIQNALLFEHERHIAHNLQDALLAEEPPLVEGLQIATLYRAAGGSMVGGDVHNVWQPAAGRVAVLVGDVAGKGIAAAGTTGMVRYILEGLAAEQADPAILMDQLSHMTANRLGDAAFVTAFLAMIDLERDEIIWTNAGHPPPIVIAPDGHLHTLEDPDPPIGFMTGMPYRHHREPFTSGSLLVMTTDGITEAGPPEDQFGEERLAATVRQMAQQSVHDIATGIYSAARNHASGPLHDDVALAVVRRTGVPMLEPILAADAAPATPDRDRSSTT